MKNQVLYFTKPNEVTVLENPIPKPKRNEVLVKNILSGISAGTELLLYKGLFPENLALDASIPSLQHNFSYPFKYGYCSVGQVVETGHQALNHLLDQWVFVFNPHEGFFCASEEQIIPLPKDLNVLDAVFIPYMETAVNLILDGTPLIGESVLILGLGILGLLTSALLQQFPLASLLGMDLHENRRQLSMNLGVHKAFDASESSCLLQHLKELKLEDIDLIYELTGNPAALNQAIEFAAYEGRIILGSWYGRKPSNIHLGGRFHRNRIQVIASQVSTIASKLQGRWTKARRFDLVFKMLEKIKPSQFITNHFCITEAHKAYQLLESKPNETLFITLNYEV